MRPRPALCHRGQQGAVRAGRGSHLPADPVEGQAVGDLIRLPLEICAGCHDNHGPGVVWQPCVRGYYHFKLRNM